MPVLETASPIDFQTSPPQRNDDRRIDENFQLQPLVSKLSLDDTKLIYSSPR